MASVTICSDFGAPQNKVTHCFHCFRVYFPWSDGTRCHDYQSLNIFYIIYLIFKKITSVHSFMIMCILNHSPRWKVFSWEQGLCPVSNIIIIVLPVRAWMTRCPRKLWGLSWAAPPLLLPVSQEEFILLSRTPMLLILYYVSPLYYEGQKLSLIAFLHSLASTGPWTW